MPAVILEFRDRLPVPTTNQTSRLCLCDYKRGQYLSLLELRKKEKGKDLVIIIGGPETSKHNITGHCRLIYTTRWVGWWVRSGSRLYGCQREKEILSTDISERQPAKPTSDESARCSHAILPNRRVWPVFCLDNLRESPLTWWKYFVTENVYS